MNIGQCHAKTSITAVVLKFVAISIVLFLSAGCAPKVKVSMLQPAQYHQASITKRIAVLPFGGSYGNDFTSELEGLLGDIFIDGEQYFTLVDRTAIDQTMGELQLSLSGAIDEKTAAKVGELVGAQGIYTGRVTLSSCTDSPFKRQRSECVKREIKYDKKGNAYEGACIRWRRYSVPCTKRVANFSCSPKLIDVATGRIIYSRNLSGSATASACEDIKPIPAEAELLRKAREIVKAQLRNDIAPSRVTKSVKLMNSKAGITSDEAKDKLKRGLAYAGNQRLDAACVLWEEASLLSPDAPSLLFNLGVCAESQGDYVRAMELYKKADKLIGKPDDSITAALKRTTTAISNQEKLVEQLKGSD